MSWIFQPLALAAAQLLSTPPGANEIFVDTQSFMVSMVSFVLPDENIVVDTKSFVVSFPTGTNGVYDTGVVVPTLGTAASSWGAFSGGTAWTNASNLLSSNDVYATCAAASSPKPLIASGFDFSAIPVGAELIGIQGSVELKCSSNGATNALAMNFVADYSDTAGTAVYSADYTSITPTTTDATYTLGGSESVSNWDVFQYNANDVGRVTVTNIKNPKFGVMVAGNGSWAVTHSVDQMTARVWYRTNALSVSEEISVATLDLTLGRGTQSTTGWTNAGAAAEWSVGGGVVSNPSLALTQDDAPASISQVGITQSNPLLLDTFGFTIPTDSSIDSVEPELDMYMSVGGVYGKQLWYGPYDVPGNITSMECRLSGPSFPMTDTDTYLSYADTPYYAWSRGWRRHTVKWDGIDVSGVGDNTTFRDITPADVNLSTFGMMLFSGTPSVSGTVTYYVDHVRVQIWYTVGDITIEAGQPPVDITTLSFGLTTIPVTIDDGTTPYTPTIGTITTAVGSHGGDYNWASTGNIATSNDVYASSGSGSTWGNNKQTYWLILSNLGLAIPDDEDMIGFKVDVEGFENIIYTIKYKGMRILHPDAALNPDAAQVYPSTTTSVLMPTSDSVTTWGNDGSISSWTGLTVLPSTTLNNSNFGVAFYCDDENSGGGGNSSGTGKGVFVDNVTITLTTRKWYGVLASTQTYVLNFGIDHTIETLSSIRTLMLLGYGV